MIYAIDFDGTLCEGAFPQIGKPKLDNIAKAKQLQAEGNKILLWTCRQDDQLQNAIDWCHNHGLDFDEVNENLPESVKKFNGSDSRKVSADFYIDDKNLSFDELPRGSDENVNTIPVKGYITSNDFAPIYRDWLGMTVVSPSDIVDKLPDDGSDVTLEIASDGGEVDPATEICNALRAYSGNVTAKVVSNAYSAATIVAMGANTVQMAPGAKMMIHRASSDASGNVNDINKASGMLQTTDNAIADLYATKTGKPANDFIDLMDSETWLTADQAIELGLADEKLDFDAPIVNAVGPIIPHKAVQRIKDLKDENDKLRSQLPKQNNLLNKKLAIFYDKKEVQ